MRTLSLQRGDAFILVYDVTKAETFEEIRHTRDEIHVVRHTNNVPIVVVGNKTDLVDVEPREVSSLNDITGGSGVRAVRAYIVSAMWALEVHSHELAIRGAQCKAFQSFARKLFRTFPHESPIANVQEMYC